MQAHTKIFRDFDFKAAPGAVNWLSILEEYKVPRVVWSSLGEEEARYVLEKAGLLDLFQEVVSADDVATTD